MVTIKLSIPKAKQLEKALNIAGAETVTLLGPYGKPNQALLQVYERINTADLTIEENGVYTRTSFYFDKLPF